MAENSERPEKKTITATKARIAEIEAKKASITDFISAADSERARLEQAIRQGESERDTAAKAVTLEGLEAEGADSKGIIHKLLTQRSHEPGLNQLRDNVSKLQAAINEAGRKLKHLRAEEERLNKDLRDLAALKSFEQAQKHFKALCGSWQSVEADHAEFVRLLAEVQTSGADIARLLKTANVGPETLFGVVANSQFGARHSCIELIRELADKPSIWGNVFHHPERERAASTGVTEFRKGHAFNGINFNGRE